MNVLATALSEAMRASAHDLVVFDKAADTWTRRPWSHVHARAEGIATRILDQPQPGAVGLVGEPTADFVAAIHATWLAGRSLSILPGPVRGADPQQWAHATLTRFSRLGVRTVFSHGDDLALLRDVYKRQLPRREATASSPDYSLLPCPKTPRMPSCWPPPRSR